jgi:hypothetical protein
MFKRASVIILKKDAVLLVKLKEQDKLLPRASWVFPFLNISEDESPRKNINDFLSRIGLKYTLSQRIFKYNPSENPKISYIVYVADYLSGEPEISGFFQAYKWVNIHDITAYSTSFMDGEISKYLNDIASKATEN